MMNVWQPTRTSRTLNAQGFSLVESLLALLVITVLLGLIWPALAESRQRALSARCASNLRQVGAALLAHSVDHKGLIPPHIEIDPKTGKGIPGTFWHQVLRSKGYIPSSADESTDGGRTAAQKNGVHFCPLLPSKGGSEESYGLRRWRTPGASFDTTQNLLVLENRADFFLAVDSYKPEENTQGYFVNPGAAAYRIHLKHSGLANTLFADGHVASVGRAYFDEIPVRQKTYQNGLPFSFWPEPSF